VEEAYMDARLEGFDGRLDDLKGYVDGRFDDVEKRMEGLGRRLDVVYGGVSSIKTDIVKMMREMLERAYGEGRA
jgi:hypothetical protein